MDYAKKVASELLRIEAVKLRPDDPFTWASGIKSPIYTDNRVALAYPEVRNLIRDGLAAYIRTLGTVDAVVGVATAGIPHAATTADKLGLPMAYVRGKAKGHGRQNRIEGCLRSGNQVVVVEDLISTGGSALDAVAALRKEDIKVLSVCAIFTYGFDAALQKFERADCPLYTLTDYPALLTVGLEQNKISEDQLELLSAWRTKTSERLR